MIDLLLAVACSLAIGMILKYAGRRGMGRLPLLTANYAVAFLLGGLFLLVDEPAGGLQLGPGLVLLGTTTGVLFILGFFMLSLATDVAGMSLALGVMRVSVVIPVLASWGIWGEVPSPAQGAGLVLASVAFFLIARRGGPAVGPRGPAAANADGRTFAVLALLFVVGGAVDVCMKAFDEVFAPANSRALFLMMVFGVAALVGLAAVLVGVQRQERGPGRATLAWGVLLGVVNYGSAVFILRAIEALSGPFFFPANNIALVIGGALLGVYVWGEHLSRVNWIGLGLAAGALVLLSL